MKKLYTKDEFNNAKSSDKLPLQCCNCDKTFYKRKKDIKECLVNRKKQTGKYCSVKCAWTERLKPLSEVQCKQCEKIFLKKPHEIKRSNNNFCSRSCSATYNMTHKVKGVRVSKLEKWLSEKLTIQYPDLEIHFNRKDAINSELDIYIPILKLAFELNGIFHYEPIYGPDKLKQIKNNDNRKFQACIEQEIELVIIDTSTQNYFKEKSSIKFFNIICEIVNMKIGGTDGC